MTIRHENDDGATDQKSANLPIVNSLRLKIPVMVISLVALVLTLSFLFIMRVHEKQFRDIIHMNMSMITSTIEGEIHHLTTSGHAQEVQKMFETLIRQKNVKSIRIFRENGTVKFASTFAEVGSVVPQDHMKNLRSHNWETYDFIEDQNGERTIANKTIPLRKESSCAKCHETTALGDPIGVLELSISMDKVNAVLKSDKTLITIIWAVTLFMVGASLVYFLRTQVVDRIASLQSNIRSTDGSDLFQRLPVVENDEIGRLAQTLNDLLDRLEKARNELREAHIKEVQHLDRLATVGELAAGVAHEIKNPLAGISAIIQNISRETISEERKEIFEEIHKQIQRIDRVMRNLLQFARPQTPHFELTDVNDCLESAMLLLSSQRSGSGINIVKDLSPNIPPINVDRMLLQQVCVNIILNAIQARKKGEPLTISILTEKIDRRPDIEFFSDIPSNRRKNSSALHICVRDNGVGIPLEIVPNIFKPFFTTKQEGTGLGLPICRRVVHDHGGRIAVESEPGKGTAFHIYIPIEEPLGDAKA